MLKLRFYILLLFSISLATVSYSQKVAADSSSFFKGEVEHIDHKDLEELHSPKKATIMSAILPGAGQIYNKKYWKAPVIWGGIATALYLSQVNRKLYLDSKTEYNLELGYPNTQSKYHGQATLASLETRKNSDKQQMESAYIVAGSIYILQIIDAFVDAHLMEFDISDDLSLDVIPSAYPNLITPTPTLGVTLSLNLE